MNMPKVKFTNISLPEEVNLIYWFLFQNEWDWGGYIVRKHPEIKDVFSLDNREE